MNFEDNEENEFHIAIIFTNCCCAKEKYIQMSNHLELDRFELELDIIWRQELSPSLWTWINVGS